MITEDDKKELKEVIIETILENLDIAAKAYLVASIAKWVWYR